MSAGADPAPTFSVLVPVYDTDEGHLVEAIASVRSQTCQEWQLVLVDDGSTRPHVARVLDDAARSDPRITVEHLPSNRGIVAASQGALELAGGEFVALMDHDDLLAPDALEACAGALDADVDYLYTDEDRLFPAEGGGYRAVPQRKPDWSPERLRAQMYTSHLSVLRRSLVVEVGGFRPGFDGSQDYDLVLRVTERARRVVHLPRLAYRWRVVAGSVSETADRRVFDAARRALEEHLQRQGIDGRVEQTDPTGAYRVHRRLKGRPLVSLVIPTRGSRGTVRGKERTFVVEAVRSIVERSSYPRLEVVAVTDESTPSETIAELEGIAGDALRTVAYRGPFNFARKVNQGVIAGRGQYVVPLNDDVEVISPDWIETMLGLAQDDGVGMVGALLLFEDGTIQHAGHVYRSLIPFHVGYGEPADERGPMFAYHVERECSGVTAACAMLSRATYFAVGGMSTPFAMNYNDVDLSCKVRAAGLRVVFTPHARLYHFESKSRATGRVGHGEVVLVQQRWGRVLEDDPYWPS